MRSSLSFVLSVVLLAGTVQAGNPADLFPEDCLFFLGSPGTQALESDLATTPYGKLLAHPRMKKLAAKFTEVGEKLRAVAWNEVPPEFLQGFTMIERILTERSIGIGVMEIDPTPGRESIQAALVIDAGDRASEIAEMIDGALEAMEVDAPALEIEGHPFRRIVIPDAPFEIVYGVVGGQFVAGVGTESVSRVLVRLRGNGANALSRSKAFAKARSRLISEGDDAYSSVYLNLPRVLTLVERISSREDADVPPEIRTLLAKSGIDRLGPIAFLSGIAKGGFQGGFYLPIEGLTPATTHVTTAELELVPRDTLFFSAEEFDVLEAYHWLRDTALAVAGEDNRPQIEQQLAGAEAMLGTTFEELCAGVGKRFVFFEEPGMRGVLPGFVLALQPENAEPVRRAIASVCGLAGIAASQEGIRIQLRETKVGEHKIDYVHIAGAPIPVAPAWAQVGDHLLFGLHPANLEETILRLEDGGESILDNPKFVERHRSLPDNACSIYYFDTPRLIGYLYPSLVPLAQAAIGMATKIDLDLDASMIPSARFFANFLAPDVMATVREDGGVWSINYSSTPVSGAVLGAAVGIGVVGLLAPAVMSAREKAEQIRTMNDLKQLAVMALMYADDHGDTFPTTFEALFEDADDFFQHLSLEHCRAKYQLRSTLTKTSARAHTPLVWERMSHSSDGTVCVVYVTGGVGLMGVHELQDALKESGEK